ncbi:MAG: HPF/RaiA family ribosome-associated protein [Candidatus Gracilibacteria bacterium]|nr:HPF/RaiA family ribosome-associated protein [Candidatus Gracilibacteria bacterium]
MNIQYHFKHVTDVAKADIKEYADKRFENLEKFISSYQEDNKLLHVDVEFHDKKSEFEIKSNLTLGGHHLHHVEMCHNYMEGVDKSEANLIRQAKKHVDHLRDNVRGDQKHVEEVVDAGRDMNYDNI